MVGRDLTDARRFLRSLFETAVATADPMRRIPRVLPPRPAGRVVVVGGGKASARMAEAVEAAWGPCEGLIITRDGYARTLRGIEVVEAAHPVPDARGVEATGRLIGLLQSCGENDFVLALISGGGSSLLTQPAGTITLDEEQALTRALLAPGAPIEAMNVVRQQLSIAKGGRLAAAAYPARMLSLIISDVPGDDPAMIASGPTVGGASSAADARRVLAQWRIPTTASIDAVLDGPPVPIRPGAPELMRVENRIVAAPAQSLEAAGAQALEAGWTVHIVGDAIEGEAREVVRDHAARALAIRDSLRPEEPPVVLLSGGECTVTQHGGGTGGPNAEYCLALALALDGARGIAAISCDTDGVDGAAEVAGAIVDETTLARAKEANLDAARSLSANDSHSFFASLGDQVVTGPTLTNVNDFRALVVF